MLAILFVTHRPTDVPTEMCLPLSPVLDRPFLRHLIERLANHGVREVHLVLGDHAAEIEQALGDGSRWGCTFTHHLARDPGHPYRMLRTIPEDGKPVIVGHADSLPTLAEMPPGLWELPGGGWSGWGLVPVGVLKTTPPSADRVGLERHLATRGVERVTITDEPLRLTALNDVLLANRRVLSGECHGLMHGAREVRPGVWLSPKANISASARLDAPVFIGENTSVGDGAAVGPFAVVGSDCLVDTDAVVRQAVVLPHSYVGQGVQVESVLVDRNRVLNPRRGRADTVDGLFLGSMTPRHPMEPLGSALLRLVILLVFLAGLPLLLAAVFWLKLTRRGPLVTRRTLVRTPASTSDARWRTYRVRTLAPARPDEDHTGWIIPATPRGLVLELLPALLHVALGDLRLVGLPARTAESLQALPDPARTGYLRTPAGLMTEVALLFPGAPNDEDVTLADAFQTHASSWRDNASRLWRFVLRGLGLVAGPKPTVRVRSRMVTPPPR